MVRDKEPSSASLRRLLSSLKHRKMRKKIFLFHSLNDGVAGLLKDSFYSNCFVTYIKKYLQCHIIHQRNIF